jgi:hypothetical protein
MKTMTKKGLTLAMAVAVLGALAVAPRTGYSADSEAVDKNSPEYQRAYRDSYNQAYSQSQAAEQKKLEEEESEKQGGCCG